MSDMTETFEIFKELQSTSKKTEKAKILKDNERNILLGNLLKFLLSSYTITGINVKKLSKNLVHITENILDFPSLLEYLKENNTGRDVDIATVQATISKYPKDEQEMCRQIVTKSLKLGVDTKIVNSVYGKGFIPVFDVQLGTPLDKVKLKGDEYIYISQKLNGCRCVSLNNKLFTRSGKEYTGLDHIIADIQKFNLPDLVFDGELIRKNTDVRQRKLSDRYRNCK